MENDKKKTKKSSSVSISHGGRPGTTPPFMALRRHRLCRPLDFRCPAFRVNCYLIHPLSHILLWQLWQTGTVVAFTSHLYLCVSTRSFVFTFMKINIHRRESRITETTRYETRKKKEITYRFLKDYYCILLFMDGISE